MRICGIEIKGLESIIAILDYSEGLFNIPECRVRKLELNKQNRSSDLIYFQKTFSKLIEDYKIQKVAIKERPLKGKFAGGALGFKMEASLQLIPNLNVEILKNSDLKIILKQNPLPVEFSETGFKLFQQTAFETAYAAHMLIQYPINKENKTD